MNDFNNILKILINNSTDVEEIVRQFGGVGALLKAAPALLRIMRTISAEKDPVDAAERASRTLVYSQETKHKVELFQQKHHLHIDGIVGNLTWQAVEDALAEKH